MQNSLIEVVEAQSKVIQLQSEVINSLFGRLAQCLAVEGADLLPESAKMNEIENLLTHIGGI